jgi:serine/threonine-protein kinase RsbW
MKGDRAHSPGRVTDLHWRVPARAARLSTVRDDLADWAWLAGMSADDVEDLAMACYEAMANVVVHAYGGEVGILDVHATRSAGQNTVTVTVSVTDYGHWRPAPDDPGRAHGGGLCLIRQLAHSADVMPTAAGTTVRMQWTLSR